jgi:hypothetical protein
MTVNMADFESGLELLGLEQGSLVYVNTTIIILYLDILLSTYVNLSRN